MWRRPLRRVDVAQSWQRAREQFASLKTERNALRQELAEAKRELEVVRAQLNDLSAAVLERNRAYDNVRILRRERDIVRARHAERDPSLPLH
jgi:chromosome segregation ATPase